MIEHSSISPAPPLPSLADEVGRLMRELTQHHFPEAAASLRKATPAILLSWRECSLKAVPGLDRLTVDEFENSIGSILHALSEALECLDPARITAMIEKSPAHGVMRFIQRSSPQTLLAEERILRSVVVIELRRELRRPLAADEAAALHELLDLMGEYSLLAMINRRGEEREKIIQHQVSGMHRLADLGVLVAGIAHDATNLLLPLRMRLERLKRADLPHDVREDLTSIGLIVKQFQNSIVNLRWLSIDSTHAPVASANQPRFGVNLILSDWAVEVTEFYQRMTPPGIELRFDLSPDPLRPPVGISSAALSQAVFNLIHNAQQAITSAGGVGRITVRAASRTDGGVDLTVEDDGPGMTPQVLRRSTEPFFTTKEGGSGLGLALARALVDGCGGSIEFHSPPPGRPRGTAAVLVLPPSLK